MYDTSISPKLEKHFTFDKLDLSLVKYTCSSESTYSSSAVYLSIRGNISMPPPPFSKKYISMQVMLACYLTLSARNAIMFTCKYEFKKKLYEWLNITHRWQARCKLREHAIHLCQYATYLYWISYPGVWYSIIFKIVVNSYPVVPCFMLKHCSKVSRKGVAGGGWGCSSRNMPPYLNFISLNHSLLLHLCYTMLISNN